MDVDGGAFGDVNGNGARTLSEVVQGWNLAPTPAAAERDVRVFAEYDVSRARDGNEDEMKGNGHDDHDDEREGNYRRWVNRPSSHLSISPPSNLTTNTTNRFNTLPFPLLDSFPPLFASSTNNNQNQEPPSSSSQHTNNQDPSQPQPTLSLLATLQSTSATSTWLKTLERVARVRVPAEEREELVNGLMELAEAYKGGFDDDEEEWDV